MKKYDDALNVSITEDESGEYAGKSKKEKAGRIVARVVCLFAAFLVWIYVMSVDSPDYEETLKSLGVALENTSSLKNEYNMSVISGTGNVADVTIKGKKSVLSRYSAEDIKVYVDLSGITDAGRHTLEIKAELPEGVMLVDIAPSSIEIYVDNDTTKNVRVVARATSYTLDANYELGELVPDVDEIIVRGPAGKLDQIEHALIELDLGSLSESVISRGQLKLVDASGEEIDDPYLKLSTSSVQVSIPVYTYKTVPLTAEYKYGFLNEDNADVAISPSAITLKADPKVLEGINAISIVTVDEKKISGNYHQEIQFTLPANVICESGETSATIDIKHKNTGLKVLSVTDFKVINPRGIIYEMADSLNVVLRAPASLLPYLTPEYITATVDLSTMGATSGVVNVPVLITVDPAVEGKVYEMGDYRIQLEIYE